jgi:hypothetical protein
MRTRRPRSATIPPSAFAGFCFPPGVIVLAVRWCLRFALSYRDVEELLTECGVQVDHVSCLSVGAAVCAAAGRGRPALPPCRRRPLAGRRDLCQGRWPVALCLPGDRRVRVSHRCVRVPAAGRCRGPPVFPRRHRHDVGGANRGGHRPRAGMSGGALLRCADPGRLKRRPWSWIRPPGPARQTRPPLADSPAPQPPARSGLAGDSGRAMPGDDHPGAASCLRSRIGRSRAFSRPWSASTRLLAYRSVRCHAAGSNSSSTIG